jgi:xanthine dehydrogenase accessory factor
VSCDGDARPERSYAVVLGTNEIATALGIALRRAGWSVVLAHDPNPPVLRRGMSFHDALFGDPAVIDGVAAWRADTALELIAAVARGSGAIVTRLGLLDLIVLDRLDVLVDARMQPAAAAPPDLRWLARVSVGLGPAFLAGANCDIAVGPAQAGAARPAEAKARRWVHAPAQGVWRTPVEIGTHIFRDFVLGHLDGAPIRSPIDGVITGAVRDGAEVWAGVELAEIDRRVRKARWRGLDDRGRAFAVATLAAIRERDARQAPLGARLGSA